MAATDSAEGEEFPGTSSENLKIGKSELHRSNSKCEVTHLFVQKQQKIELTHNLCRRVGGIDCCLVVSGAHMPDLVQVARNVGTEALEGVRNLLAR